MRDSDGEMTVVWLLPAKRYTVDTNGTAINLYGEARKVGVALSVGTVGTSTVTVTIQESTDNSTWTTLHAFDAKASTGAVYVDLTPTKKYVRAIAVLAATNTYYVDFGVCAGFYYQRYYPSHVA